MRTFPSKEHFLKVLHFVRTVRDMQVQLYAANAGFFVVLSLFPFLVLILGLLRYTGLQVDTLAAVLEGILPQALLPTVNRLILSTYSNTSGLVIGFSALTSLWSASRGVHGIIQGLNAIYDAHENRGYVYTRSMGVFYTILLLLVLFLTLALHVFGTTILAMIPAGSSRFLDFLGSVLDLRFFLLLFLQTGLFCAMYMVLPNRNNTFRDSLPGALLASIGWQVFSNVYSIYVDNFAGLSNIYGSVYAIALSMLWLYFCLSILFYGGALNKYLMDKGEN